MADHNPAIEALVDELARTENSTRIEKLLREALEAAARRGYVEGLQVAARLTGPSQEQRGHIPAVAVAALEDLARTLQAGAATAASGRAWPPKGGR